MLIFRSFPSSFELVLYISRCSGCAITTNTWHLQGIFDLSVPTLLENKLTYRKEMTESKLSLLPYRFLELITAEEMFCQ